jgi:hypothetical protein
MNDLSPSDQRHYEPRSAEELMTEFPGWHVWEGVNSLFYARRPRTSPPVVVGPGEDLMDLRDQIIIWIRRHQ